MGEHVRVVPLDEWRHVCLLLALAAQPNSRTAARCREYLEPKGYRYEDIIEEAVLSKVKSDA